MSRMNAKSLAETLVPQTIQTPLGKIEYAEYGEGPVVLSLHGAMGGYDQSAILAQTVLTGQHRVIAVSRPGYLATPLVSGDTPEAQSDLLAALLNALAIEQASVIAISGGGPAAIYFALRHTSRCRALVLCSTVSRPNTFKIPIRFQLLKLMARLPILAGYMRGKAVSNLEKIAKRSINNSVCLQNLMGDPEAWSLYRDLTLSTFDCMAQRMAGTENDFHVTQTYEYPLEKIVVPTLIVHGSDDPFVNFTEHAESARQRIGTAEVLTLVGGEHAAIFTHRNLVQRKLKAFLVSDFSQLRSECDDPSSTLSRCVEPMNVTAVELDTRSGT